MSIFYLDFVGGNDANDGLSFANRWKTFAGGATAGRLTNGDTIRIKETPAPTLVGNATWTDNSATITLAGAVTANIDTGESAWTASANITTSVSTARKQGTGSMQINPAAGFTTGKMAYKALGAPLDLSAYQQVSFWFSQGSGACQLCLCSDTTGDVPVHTIDIPAGDIGVWWPITKDFGANLSSSIQSVALYAVTDPGTSILRIDNIIACKASASADSLTLNSLIGKAHNLPWAPSTAYTVGQIRVPLPGQRNGLGYQCTTAGTSGASEPTWPDALGATVTDGTAVWTAYDVEDGWWAIAGINGTTVTLDANGVLNGVYPGYAGTTETVATYKRECYNQGINNSVANILNKTGSVSAPMIVSGGWNATDMSTQTGETWLDRQNSNTIGFRSLGSGSYINLDNYHVARSEGTAIDLSTTLNTARNVSGVCANIGFLSDGVREITAVRGGRFNQCGAGLYGSASQLTARNVNLRGCSEYPVRSVVNSGIGRITVTNGALDSAKAAAFYTLSAGSYKFINCSFRNAAPMQTGTTNITLINPSNLLDATLPAEQAGNGHVIRVQKWNGSATDNRAIYDVGVVRSVTDVMHAATGMAWRFNPTDVLCLPGYPLKEVIAQIYCEAGVTKTISVWTRRNNTNVVGELIVRGEQLAGVPESKVTCTPAINTWVQSGPITITPTESGVIEVEFAVYDGVGTTNAFWIDDMVIA